MKAQNINLETMMDLGFEISGRDLKRKETEKITRNNAGMEKLEIAVLNDSFIHIYYILLQSIIVWIFTHHVNQ